YFRQFKNSLSECFQFFHLWQKTLKVIGSQFGTSVCSYFVFLTWLLMFNLFSFLVNFSFITVPQLLEAKANNLSFTGLEFFTGAGYFTETVLYYGFYINGTISEDKGSSPYNMQLTYIFTIGVYFILCFLSLLYSMAKSFRRNFINPSMYSGNAAKLLCIWDFSVTSEKAVKLKQKNLSTQMKLFLKDDKTELESEAVTLVLPVVVGLLNHMVPFFYSFFGFVEKFTYPKHQIYTSIGRNIILKISIIGILCYYWLNIVAVSKVQCWETLVGQDIYRLVVAEFICCLLGSFFGEFARRIIGTKCCKQLGVPEFDIARNVLDLIYAQTLAWIGIFFSPLIPAIQIISFFIIFYVKKVSLMMNCQPPRKAWRAAQMNTLFIFLLFFPSFTGVLSVIAVIVWRIITYLYWQIIDGRKIMVKLLQEQIINEGKDKMFLLKKLRALQAPRLPDPGEQREPSGMPETNRFTPRSSAVPRRSAFAPQSEMTSFSQAVPGNQQPDGTTGVSEALALALRARQEAEWETDEEDFRS
ncbi:UNVERIFIED_CONTAM: hypothetical protein K2H54_025243, partial [Gekko kuhli]